MNIDSHNIDELLNRFFDGDTTCAEDRALQAYFADTDTLPEHLRQYAPMFAWYADGMPTEPGAELKPAAAPRRRAGIKPLLWWASTAAAVAIVFAAGWQRHTDAATDNMLARQYEGSYTEVNGVINTDIADIKAEIDITQLEAQRIERELEAASLTLESESYIEFTPTTQNSQI